MSSGKQFRQAIDLEKPLQIPGVINAYVAMMAKQAGFKALYLSGAGVANSSYGLPDIGLTTLDNVLEDARRIIDATHLPLLVDIDTGWGSPLMIERVIKQLENSGVAAIHIEDQDTLSKRCGHLSGKQVVSLQEMQERIRAAVQAKSDPHFVVMARTDALAIEGLESTLERANAYVAAGADMLFIEAITSLQDYRYFKTHISVPILANLTEFGKTPLFTIEELRSVGIDMVLYPLSANRAMNRAAEKVLHEIRSKGTQAGIVSEMQTRAELYQILNYKP